MVKSNPLLHEDDLTAPSVIPSHWKWATLGDTAEFFNGDRSSNYPKQSDFAPHGVPFVNTGHIAPTGRLAIKEMNYISQTCFDKLRGGKLKSGDIVYCLRGSTIGKTARVGITEGAIASSLVIIRAKPSVLQDYLYYFLAGPLGQRLVKQHDNGSAQPNLSVQAISQYPFPLPPAHELLHAFELFHDEGIMCGGINIQDRPDGGRLTAKQVAVLRKQRGPAFSNDTRETCQ